MSNLAVLTIFDSVYLFAADDVLSFWSRDHFPGSVFHQRVNFFLVETDRRLGSTGHHMSHQRQHHICLDMGRTIICYMCIALMAEP